MKTEYKILWIDDSHRYVRGDKRSIKTFLDQHGIELIIKDIDTSIMHPMQDKSFEDDVADINLDMVFIDFNMTGQEGDKIIHHIRKNLHHYHLPILFYTGNADAKSVLQKSIADMNDDDGIDALNIIDGIYFCDRDHIFDKAKNILTSLLKKESLPQQGRGLLMDRVSEIDAKILQAIELILPEVPQEKKSKVKKELNDRINDKLKMICKLRKENKSKSYEDIATFIRDNISKIDTFAKARILKEMLKSIPELNGNGRILSDFCHGDVNLNDIRNSYAHKTSSDIETDHNDERCKYIRTETRKQIENLNKILIK